MLSVSIKKRQGDMMLDVNFDVSECGIVAIFGPSGAGKTTLINCIAGLIAPDEGSIVCRGMTCFDAKQRICLSPEQRHVGYVFQDGRLFPHLSVRANLLFGPRFGRAGIHDGKAEPTLNSVTELLGIRPLLTRRPGTLSGGEKQRIAIGRALLSRPDILLMDEPLTALDAARKDELMDYIGRIPTARGIPVLYVTHSLEELTRLADRVILLRHGTMTAFGPVLSVLGKTTMGGPHFPSPFTPGDDYASCLSA